MTGLGFETSGWFEIETESEGETTSAGEDEDLERKSFDRRLLDLDEVGEEDEGEDVPHTAESDILGAAFLRLESRLEAKLASSVWTW